jgi:hypothetical protein
MARTLTVGPDRDVDRGSDGFRIVLVELPADHSLRRDQDDDRHAAEANATRGRCARSPGYRCQLQLGSRSNSPTIH